MPRRVPEEIDRGHHDAAPLVLVRGSGHVFCDLGHKNVDRSSSRPSRPPTSHESNADLGRFTVDRVMSILSRLGGSVE